MRPVSSQRPAPTARPATAQPPAPAGYSGNGLRLFDTRRGTTVGAVRAGAAAAPLLPPEEWEPELQGEDALFAGLGELPECAVVFGRRRELSLAAAAPCS
ncbi:putative WRKY DNA-binding domain superfamily protein [Panicum miliaceum]|uniref:WRKY DNA-binding domain superfamily protein n=1 Tax=Panicum miliaceum TaxID=4540 RepID=A0A3L6PPY4_PANMI|nr:putative WRKY DNA-binding domain superfamily protein [Panicum miliaceum]